MQLFTQLWPAVIEILSVVLCDYRSNEFSMAVIFSLLVFSLQVKTCRRRMTKTTRVHHGDPHVAQKGLTVAGFSPERHCDDPSPEELFQPCPVFLGASTESLVLRQPARNLTVRAEGSNSRRYFILKDRRGLPTTRCGVLATMINPTT